MTLCLACLKHPAHPEAFGLCEACDDFAGLFPVPPEVCPAPTASEQAPTLRIAHEHPHIEGR